MSELVARRVVVTGATSGLGAAMADALLEQGAAVAFAARPTPRLDDAVGSRRARGLEAYALAMDVLDEDAVASAPARAFELLGGVDLVVNNAGLGMRSVNPRFLAEAQPFFDVTPEGFKAVVATNLTGYFLVARAFAPHFVERRSGRFVNVSMQLATMRARGFVPYGPSRAGAEALSHVMAEDLRPHGIAVNILAPGGATATGMIPDEIPDTVRTRLLQPSIMAAPIVFLASSEAEGLTGERIEATHFGAWLAEFRSRTSTDAT